MSKRKKRRLGSSSGEHKGLVVDRLEDWKRAVSRLAQAPVCSQEFAKRIVDATEAHGRFLAHLYGINYSDVTPAWNNDIQNKAGRVLTTQESLRERGIHRCLLASKQRRAGSRY